MIPQGEMGGGEVQGFPQGHPFPIEGIGHPSYGRLGALVVNIPGLEMFQWAGVHQNQWRMDDGSGVHQGATECVLAALNGVGLGNYPQRPVGFTCRPDAGGQSCRIAADHDPVLGMLARKVG